MVGIAVFDAVIAQDAAAFAGHTATVIVTATGATVIVTTQAITVAMVDTVTDVTVHASVSISAFRAR